MIRCVASLVCGLIAVLVTAACSSTTSPTVLGSPGQKPGTFSAFSVASYTPSSCASPLPNVTAAQQDIVSVLSSDGWTVEGNDSSSGITLSEFVNSFSNSDALFFAGHGHAGITAFSQFCSGSTAAYWGVGDGEIASNIGILPANGRLKWMFSESSDTVAPEASTDPNDTPEFVANPWEPLFYGPNGTLRAMYGYWQAPQSLDDNAPCPDGLTVRDCDVDSTSNLPVIDEFLHNAWQPGKTPPTIESEWEASNNDHDNDGIWSILTDCNAEGDTFTGPNGSTNSPRGASLCFVSEFLGTEQGSILSVPQATGVLSPKELTNENLNVQSAVQTAGSEI